jgi:magnesium transporter
MNVYWVSQAGIAPHPSAELRALLARDDGFVWVDLPTCDAPTAATLGEAFGFHPLALQECCERTHVPKLHAYADHLFVILHAPDPGDSGHIHLLELDQFVGRRFLVTVHGPLGAGVELEAALRETRAASARIASGRYRPTHPAELSYAIVSAIARRMEALVTALARRIAELERQVMQGHVTHMERTLELMFHLRHELLTIRTSAAHSREIYARISALAPRFVPDHERLFLDDLVDQFDRVRNICDGEQAFLQGVIDFYQTRTITKLNIAMERLALLSALLLPVTAIASIYGMNVIVFQHTELSQVIGVLAVIGVIMGVMFVWSKRQGWW